MEKGLKSGINFDEYDALTVILLGIIMQLSSAIVDFHLFKRWIIRIKISLLRRNN